MAPPVAIQGDAVWLPMMLQCLAKECLCRRDYYNSGFRLFLIMALARRVSRCCSVTVKRRSPLNHRVFPPPAVLTFVISRSFPQSDDLDATGNLDRLLTLPNGYRRRGPRGPVVLHDGLCLLGQLLLLLAGEAVICRYTIGPSESRYRQFSALPLRPPGECLHRPTAG